MVPDPYLWTKVIHVLAVISWMAGLFYLPRLFVYHSDSPVGSETSNLFKVMERRLLKAIMRPAALVALVSGLTLWWLTGFSLADMWLLVKLLAVLAMAGFHGLLESCQRQFANDARPFSSRGFRMLNEVPTVLLVVIVIMVIVKPWQ